MKAIALAAALMALVTNVSSASRVELQTYTGSLLGLVTEFDAAMNRFVADQMAANERHRIAKKMRELSARFYYLMLDKEEITDELMQAIDRKVSVPSLRQRVKSFESDLACLSRRLADLGPSIGAFVDLQGETVERAVRTAVRRKTRKIDSAIERIDTLDKLALDLGYDQDRENLKRAIYTDTSEASIAAHTLYQKTATFAHLLDPSVTPPRKPVRQARCTNTG